MIQCKKCRSYAVNISPESRLCDVCYYRRHVANLAMLVRRLVPACPETAIGLRDQAKEYLRKNKLNGSIMKEWL